MNRITFFIFTLFAISLATDSPLLDSVTDAALKNFKAQYRYCTGDTSDISLSKIMLWRDEISQITESSEYKKDIKEFMTHTGIVDSFLPCDVINWKNTRDGFIASKDSSISARLNKKNAELIDSILFFEDKKLNQASKFDFENIRFGYNRKSFERAYKKRKLPKYNVEREYLSSEYYTISGTPFLIKFYFNREQRFIKYEIESYRFSGNDLDDKVRPYAEAIKNKFIKQFGEPQIINRIGFFDIKSNKPQVWAHWKSKTHSVNIYFLLENSKYFTRAVVAPLKINPIKK